MKRFAWPLLLLVLWCYGGVAMFAGMMNASAVSYTPVWVWLAGLVGLCAANIVYALCCKSFSALPGMMAKGAGKIINICSMTSELGRETVSAYASAKGGLKMLTRNIASEYGGYNIQCNALAPGYIATPLTLPLRERQPDGSQHPFDKFILGRTPAARWGDPEDLAGPVVFLASPASDFVNGHILAVDGGILAYLGKQP